MLTCIQYLCQCKCGCKNPFGTPGGKYEELTCSPLVAAGSDRYTVPMWSNFSQLLYLAAAGIFLNHFHLQPESVKNLTYSSNSLQFLMIIIQPQQIIYFYELLNTHVAIFNQIIVLCITITKVPCSIKHRQSRMITMKTKCSACYQELIEKIV